MLVNKHSETDVVLPASDVHDMLMTGGPCRLSRQTSSWPPTRLWQQTTQHCEPHPGSA